MTSLELKRTLLISLLFVGTLVRSQRSDIRLVGGLNDHEGRVEVRIDGEWGTVCDDGWSLDDATVACRQLGFGAADDATSNARQFGQGSGPIHLDDVACNGDEVSLVSCGHRGLGVNNCGHSEDAGVRCSMEPPMPGSADIELEGGNSPLEGRIRIKIGGEWGTVCDDHWDLSDASVACQQLDLGTAVDVQSFGPGSGTIFLDDLDCIGIESSLTSCDYIDRNNCNHGEDAGAVCSGFEETQRGHQGIRLVGGSTKYEGRVEVYLNGKWGTVCDDLWTLTDADVACRQLGFGLATSALGQASFGQGSGSILMDNVECNGHESSLASCPYQGVHNCGHPEDAGIVCGLPDNSPEAQVNQSTIRLVGGSTKYEGRVEVYLNGQWGTVCDDLWTLTDANVACRQLGFGPATSAPGQALFGEGSGSIIMDNVGCNGHEPSLASCQHSRSHNCGHSEDAGIVCSTSGTAEAQVNQSTIRLVGGSTKYEGRVEVYLDGQWGTVCDDLWTLTDANVACRQLGFGLATSAPGQALYGRGIGSIMMDNVECRGDEVSLNSCRYESSHNCGHQEDAGIVCLAQAEASSSHRSIRLVGSSSPYEGRVELLIAGEWGTVCDDMWGIDDAMVACRQLGYGRATSARKSAPYGPGTGPIHLDDLQCAGGESKLVSCRHAGNTHNCNHGEDAGLVCLPPDGVTEEPPTVPEVSIRLVDGSSQYEGRLEVYINGRWGTVCDDLWTMTETEVACRQLGFGSAVATRISTYGDGSGRILMDNVECTGIESTLISCQYSSTHNCRHAEDVGIICNAPDGTHAARVRLVGGSSDGEGRVEVFINGQWGTVCDDLWDITDANVVCSQLGYGVATAVRDSSLYGEGTGPILMDNVQCDGTETSLISCAHSGSHNCRHEEDVGIICHQQGTALPIRLVGGTTEFEGRVEVYISKQWGTVCDDLWDMTDANVACRQLGYVKAIAIRNSNVFGQGSGPILFDDVMCVGDEASLLACPHSSSHNCGHPEDVGIVCEPPVVVTTVVPLVECPSLGRIDHPLKIICTNVTNVGYVCSYSCDDGFTLQGIAQRTCQSTGSWSPNVEETPTCEAELVTIAPVVECPALDRTNYPLKLACTNDTRDGSVCTYSCDDGFSLKGSPERTCQSTGAWSGNRETRPSCEDVSCPPLELENGETLCTNGWMYLSACMPICSLGFKLNRRQLALQCTSPGNWTEELPTCQISKCPKLPAVANGVTDCTHDTHFRSMCNITCAEGFRLVGPDSRECEAIGSWSAFQPICQDIRCPSLSSPHFGSLSCTQGSRHGSVCNSTCGVGYRAIGSQVTTCNTDGTWTHDLPTCELIRCGPEVEAPQNGNVFCLHSARVCIYSCNNGFDLAPVKSMIRTCEADGWTGAKPSCIDRRGPIFRNCPDDAMSFISDPMLDTATVNWPVPSALDQGNTKKIIGTHVSGPTPGSSLQGGSYSVVYTAEDSNGNNASCKFVVIVSVIRCPELPDEGLVTVDCSHGDLRDSICRFSCSMDGYEIVGPDMTQCVVDGDVPIWSTARPSCTDYTAPVFTDCPSSQIVFAEFNQTSAIVRWPNPRATDNSNNVLRVEMTSGNGSGSVRSEGTTLESYEAVDESGNVAQCNFNVTVKVIRCAEPQLDSDVNYTCSGNVLGSVCHFSCPGGYALQGHSSTSCQRNGFDGIWSNQLPSCIDNQSPIFTRGPEPIEVIAAPLQTNALVSWEVPTFEDQDPDAFIVQVAGPSPPQELNEGFYLVRYRAIDSARNDAEYTFNVTVKVIRCNDPGPEVNEDIEVICNHGNLRGSTCVYSCPVGFDVIGSQTTTCVMTENEMGTWNTTLPTCQARSCPPLPTSPVVVVSGCETGLGNSTTYGTNCTFSCPPGYTGVGEAVKFCQADGSWSTTDFLCQRRQCLGLSSNGIFTTTPHQCMGFPDYGDVCVVSCLLPGYQLRGPGSAEFQCMENGTWDQALDEFTCLDIEPPEILNCPEPFIVSITNPDGVDVNFDPPTARDNSNDSLRVVTSPANLTSPYYITQDTEFSYEFFDTANNSINCTFGVFVKEEFGVDILYCPEDIIVETEKEANVTWSRPQFRGENASHIGISSNVNGTSAMLQVGVHSIEYTAVNKFSGKESVCQFNVTVNSLPCPPLDSPLNGALSCRKWPALEICSMSCKNGYDIPRLPTRQQPPTLYTCSASQGGSREWKPNSNIVDCSEIKESGRSYLPADLIYYEGDCGQLVTQQTIASALASLIQASLVFGDRCKDKQCSVTDVTVTCGPLDGSLSPPPAQRRRRRMVRRDAIPGSSDGGRRNIPRPSSATNVTRISFDIETRNDINEAVEEQTDRLVQIATLVQEIIQTGTASGIDSDMAEVIAELSLDDASLLLGDIQFACDEGYVPQTGAENQCVACPRGYFSGEDTDICMPCSTGTYQDEPAQSTCKLCPLGQTTAIEGAKGSDECQDKCSPGYFSPSGLVPCLPCDRQSYQSQSGQRSCDLCPTNQKTNRYGAISDTECNF